MYFLKILIPIINPKYFCHLRKSSASFSFLLIVYTSYFSDIWYILTFRSMYYGSLKRQWKLQNFLLIWTFDNFCAKTNFGVRNQTSVRSWPKFGNPRKHLISVSHIKVFLENIFSNLSQLPRCSVVSIRLKLKEQNCLFGSCHGLGTQRHGSQQS